MWYRWDGPDLVLELLVQPRASANEFSEIVDRRLKVRLTAPPVGGEANRRLTAWLAGQFGVPRAAVVLCHGDAGRRKRVRIASPVRLPAGLGITR
jgi:uncharacterized protein (TIGR00251 family)